MSEQINPRLAFEVLARIMAQAADAEVIVSIAEKNKPAANTADAGRRGQSA